MPQRDVDIFNKDGKLIATYPVVLNGQNYDPFDQEFEKLGLQCAVEDALVNESELETLTAKVR